MKYLKLAPFLLTLLAALMFAATVPYVSPNAFSLGSTSIRDGQTLSIKQVYNGMGAGGINLSPQLSWKKAPLGTKSLAITMFDPDAPTGSGWWHWVVFNIPAATRSLPEGASLTSAMPDGCIESLTNFGKPGFGGAAPPPGDKPHHYIVTLYAVDVDHLDLNASTPPARVGADLKKHTIAMVSIMGLYSR